MLLKKYRFLNRSLDSYEKSLTLMLNEEPGIILKGKDTFTRLYEKLEFKDARDDRDYMARYVPFIRSCRYIEMAVNAVNHALFLFHLEDPDVYDVLEDRYIRCRKAPSVRETLERLHISTSTYYHRLRKGEERISEILFGSVLSRDELIGVIQELRGVIGRDSDRGGR